MQAAELTAEFGIAGVLDFVETEHGLVKAAISLDGVAGELYLQGAHLTAWQPSGERPALFTSPNSAFAPGKAIRPAWRAMVCVETGNIADNEVRLAADDEHQMSTAISVDAEP